jgi:uncharacterized damage-inducible protein DinB
MQNESYRTGAIGALLDEYERAIDDLKFVLIGVSDKDLGAIIDAETKDEDCRSIQTIVAHVVSSAYGYAIYIHKHLGEKMEFMPKINRYSSEAYCQDLDAVFQFNVALFDKYPNLNLEELENEKKILTRWGQIFDYDQLLEHAIVHILRHRRQIERFKIKLKSTL